MASWKELCRFEEETKTHVGNGYQIRVDYFRLFLAYYLMGLLDFSYYGLGAFSLAMLLLDHNMNLDAKGVLQYLSGFY